MAATKTEILIRWLIDRDMPSVLSIEQRCFETPWTEADYLECLSNEHCIGNVAQINERVVGLVVYELEKTAIRILNFAVDPVMQRRGVGSAMVRRLIAKLSQQRRKELLLEVRESNLLAQVFFRKQGFRCVQILKHFYEDTSESAYCMRYVLPSEDPSPYSPTNRISEFDTA